MGTEGRPPGRSQRGSRAKPGRPPAERSGWFHQITNVKRPPLGGRNAGAGVWGLAPRSSARELELALSAGVIPTVLPTPGMLMPIVVQVAALA